MVNKLNIADGQAIAAGVIPVIGIAHLAAPALSTAIFSQGLSAWTTIPALLENGIDNTSISFWAQKYSKLSGKTEILALFATIGLGIQSAATLKFDSFARFYFILGSLSSSVYLLFTPYFRYKIKKISRYGDPNASVGSGSNDPKSDVRSLLRAQAVSSIFAGFGLGFFWYGLFNAINNT